MTTYVIGDLQGCYREFRALLDELKFSPTDQLWLVGDLINRGPASLETLRFVRDLGEQCQVVLGNHDLHLLAIYFGGHKPSKSDTFDALLAADDIDELCHWLRTQKLLLRSNEHYLVHAGIPHIWDLVGAVQYAQEVQQVLRGENPEVSYVEFFTHMYGNQPDVWSDELVGMDRYRLITNYFTRMRLVDDAGRLNFSHKGTLENVPDGWVPWYELSANKFDNAKILFGHWAALDGYTGHANFLALDTGCVWGRTMTAYCVETGQTQSVDAFTE